METPYNKRSPLGPPEPSSGSALVSPVSLHQNPAHFHPSLVCRKERRSGFWEFAQPGPGSSPCRTGPRLPTVITVHPGDPTMTSRIDRRTFGKGAVALGGLAAL